MTEENPITTLRVQKETKPNIEEVLACYLDGETLESALGFTAFMRDNKMKFSWAGIHNAWKASSKGRCICYINLNWINVKWLVTPYLERIKDYEETITGEGLQDYVLDNVIYCAHADKYERPEGSPPVRHFGLNYPCNIWGCAPGKTITLFGREIKNKCCNLNRRFYWFKDPDEKEIEVVKRLIELEKQARAGETKSAK